jgi:hypothetical protein
MIEQRVTIMLGDEGKLFEIRIWGGDRRNMEG